MPDDAKKVDAYITAAAPFARPILEKIRRAFHAGCPGIEERIKWGAPAFVKNGIVGGMAAFKRHASFGFWRGKELDDPHGILRRSGTASFMAERLTDVSQIPALEVLADYVRRAAALNDAPRPRKKAARPKAAPKVPPDLAAALRKNARARTVYEAFSPSHQREYVEWIVEAKREETRARRIATTLEWLTQGRSRNWKYERRTD